MDDKLKPFLDRVNEARIDYSAALGQIVEDAQAAGLRPDDIVGELTFRAWLREKNRPTGQIYFAKVEGADIIKIGFSISVPDRMRALQGQHQRRFEVLGALPGTMEDERFFHSMLWWCRDRTLKGNEFFVYRPIAGLVRLLLGAADSFPLSAARKDSTRAWVDAMRAKAFKDDPDDPLGMAEALFDLHAAQGLGERKVA